MSYLLHTNSCFMNEIFLSFEVCPSSSQVPSGICSLPLLRRIAHFCKQSLGMCAVWTWGFSYCGNRDRNQCVTVWLHAHGMKAHLMHRIPPWSVLPVSAHGKAQRCNRKLHPHGFTRCHHRHSCGKSPRTAYCESRFAESLLPSFRISLPRRKSLRCRDHLCCCRWYIAA